MDTVEKALACFGEGFSCSQALLSAYGPQFGLDHESALRVAGGFGGGIACMGETCGAVTGACMVLGLRYGRTNAKDTLIKEELYRRVRALTEQFRDRNGSVLCRELMGCHIGTPEGMRCAREKKLFSTLCTKFVRDAVEIVETML